MGDLWGQWACGTGGEHSVGAYCVRLTVSLTASLMRWGPRCRPVFRGPPIPPPASASSLLVAVLGGCVTEALEGPSRGLPGVLGREPSFCRPALNGTALVHPGPCPGGDRRT